MSKKHLLENIFNDTYCRLKASKTHGVGVFAIKDIPIGVDPFKLSNNAHIKYDIIDVNETELKGLNPNVKSMLKDFMGHNDGKYSVPKLGLNTLDITFYLNHSNKNNLAIKEHKNCDYLTFETKRKIKNGEELTINYSDYDK